MEKSIITEELFEKNRSILKERENQMLTVIREEIQSRT